MKHIFVLNPAAGRDHQDTLAYLTEQLHAFDGQIQYEIYSTTKQGDATRFVRERAAAEPEEQLRFYACGGDGTANEVLHGVVGVPHASMTCYPCGSGNDYIKYYGKKEDFLNLESLINGTETPIDIMRIDDRYSMNVVGFGFDAAVLETMERVRRKPIIGGRNAYTTGIIKALFTAMKNDCTVFVDGEQINDGKYLLCTVANGKYVGGAFCCAPNSKNDDGLLEVCLVRPISVFKFLKLINVYSEGSHLDDPRFANIISYRRGTSVHVVAPKGFSFSLDGELVYKNDFTMEICPAAVRFAVPAHLAKKEAAAETVAAV